MLNVKKICFFYQEKKILHDISFSIKAGDFILLCGIRGSGKTTLLRHLKKEMLPVGIRHGSIYFEGQDIEKLDTSFSIGYVFQNPDHQIVSDRVYHELAFGLENQKLELTLMRQKIAEMLQYFNMTNIYHQRTDTLSGGQKQLLNLASILVMQPKVVLLDEPLSQLDPMMQETFMQMLKKLNDEYGTTIIIVEHQYERVLPICNKVMLLDNGQLAYYGQTNSTIKQLIDHHHILVKGLPAYYRFYPYIKPLPLTIKEVRNQIHSVPLRVQVPLQKSSTNVIGKIHEVAFDYNQPLLKSISMTLYQGDIIGIVGSNGSGKTTFLKILIGALKKKKGKIKIPKSIGYVSQDPTSLFVKDTVFEDLKSMVKEDNIIESMLDTIGLKEKQQLHPYDLSGGEQQLLALGKVLLSKPQLLLLDEPTKGLDVDSCEKIGQLLFDIRNIVTTIIVSHDVAFIAKYTNRCGMLFDGYLDDLHKTRKLLKDNTFYTTITRKICKGYEDEVLLYEDIAFV